MASPCRPGDGSKIRTQDVRGNKGERGFEALSGMREWSHSPDVFVTSFVRDSAGRG